MSRLPIAAAGALGLAALLAAGPAGIRRTLARVLELVRADRLAWTAALCLALAVPVLGRRYVDVTGYLGYLAASSVAALAALALAERFAGGAERVAARLERAPPAAIAVGALVLAVLAGQLVLEDIPHVSDEAAYQFQARTLALGRLWLDPPPAGEPFLFLHTMVDGDRWYGIMNPGWPALLALGYLVELPWLVNPLLGALALLAFHRFFRAAGIEEREARLALLLLAISPFLSFMAGSYMAHPANLLLFGLFAWAWARLLETGRLLPALAAGAALAMNVLVRPIDAAAVALPFVVPALLRLRRRPGLLLPLGLAGLVASGGIALTLAYNQALTGDPGEMPMTKYFELRSPGERFGLGFGPDMGTRLHGPEWPGYYPLDAIPVTAHRLAQFALDLHGLPLLVMALPFLALRRRDWTDWHLTLFGSALALIGVYLLHFYHGIAYGSRHYYLAAPALALLAARPLAGGLAAGGAQARLARVALAALSLHVAAFALPPLVKEYGDSYRGSSALIRRSVREHGLRDALVFVESGDWAWKSAFPLNEYPLGRGTVIFARDMGAANREVAARFPGRSLYRLRVVGGRRVELEPIGPARPVSAPRRPPEPRPGAGAAPPRRASERRRGAGRG